MHFGGCAIYVEDAGVGTGFVFGEDSVRICGVYVIGLDNEVVDS